MVEAGQVDMTDELVENTKTKKQLIEVIPALPDLYVSNIQVVVSEQINAHID